jgi:hypothetical protein
MVGKVMANEKTQNFGLILSEFGLIQSMIDFVGFEFGSIMKCHQIRIITKEVRELYFLVEQLLIRQYLRHC